MRLAKVGHDDRCFVEDNFDALLYLGPVGSITRVPDAPCEYRVDAYYAEVMRKAGV